MKRKIVKLFHGSKQISVWRITFVKLGFKSLIGLVPIDSLDYLTYFVLAPDFPTAMSKLSFVNKAKWEFYKFERFQEFDYNRIYEL